MILIQKIILQKLNTITEDQLLNYASKYNVAINRGQAKQIVKLLNGKNVNIFNDSERVTLIKNVAKITSPTTAQEVNKIIQQFLK